MLRRALVQDHPELYLNSAEFHYWVDTLADTLLTQVDFLANVFTDSQQMREIRTRKLASEPPLASVTRIQATYLNGCPVAYGDCECSCHLFTHAGHPEYTCCFPDTPTAS